MKKAISLILVTLSFTALGKVEGLYEIKVKRTSGPVTVDREWDCKSLLGGGYSEQLPNHAGEQKIVRNDIQSRFQSSVLETSSSVLEKTHRIPMDSSSPLEVTVTERCENDYTVIENVTNCDMNNVCTTSIQTRTETDTMKVHWNCHVRAVPKTTNQKVKVPCVKGQTSGGGYDIKLFNKISSSSFEAEVTLNRVYETFAANLCKGKDLKKRKVIKVSQGMQGLWGENDYIVRLEIPGLTGPIELTSQNGIFNHEIAICRDEDIQVTVTAMEKDPLFLSDSYSCQEASNTVVLSSRRKNLSEAELTFKRNNLAGLFLNKKQVIKLDIRDYPAP